MFSDEIRKAGEELLIERYRDGYFAGQRAKLTNATYFQEAEKQDSFPGVYGFYCGFYCRPYDVSWV